MALQRILALHWIASLNLFQQCHSRERRRYHQHWQPLALLGGLNRGAPSER
jgi:hypothetical protein